MVNFTHMRRHTRTNVLKFMTKKKKRMVKKQKQQRKTFYSLEDATLWQNEMQADKIEANRKKQDFMKKWCQSCGCSGCIL